LLKHHTYLNWTQFGLEEPTYINIVRHPVSQFASFYYFKRYGWGFNESTRKMFHGSDEEREMTMDQCVKLEKEECMKPIFTLIKEKFSKRANIFV